MKPLIELPFLSHGHATLKDVEESVRFYRDFLGLDVLKTSPRTLVARLGSNTAIVGVTLGEKGLAKAARPWLENAHFGQFADHAGNGFTGRAGPAGHFAVHRHGLDGGHIVLALSVPGLEQQFSMNAVVGAKGA